MLCNVHVLISLFSDVSDIQGFVTVALATAAGGEDDLAHDKLSHLRTVGSGFASLIYNVKEGDGFKQLEMKCMSLWEVLQSNNNLPKLLVLLLACLYTLLVYKYVPNFPSIIC